MEAPVTKQRDEDRPLRLSRLGGFPPYHVGIDVGNDTRVRGAFVGTNDFHVQAIHIAPTYVALIVPFEQRLSRLWMGVQPINMGGIKMEVILVSEFTWRGITSRRVVAG